MWFLPLLFVLGAGAVLSTSGCRRTPQPPVPDHLPNPQNATEVTSHTIDEFIRHDGESCEQFSQRFHPITVTNPASTYSALNNVVARINMHGRTQVGKVVYNFDDMRRDLELHHALTSLTPNGLPQIPDLGRLVEDGAPGSVDTPLDIENLVKMQALLEDLLTTSNSNVVTARNTPGFTAYLYSLKIYVRSGELAPSYVVTNRSVRQTDRRILEQIQGCSDAFAGVLSTPPGSSRPMLIVMGNRSPDAGGGSR